MEKGKGGKEHERVIEINMVKAHEILQWLQYEPITLYNKYMLINFYIFLAVGFSCPELAGTVRRSIGLTHKGMS